MSRTGINDLSSWKYLFTAALLVGVVVDARAEGTTGKCDYTDGEYSPPTFARLQTGNYGKCINRRKDDWGGALTLTSRSDFATHCPVVIAGLDKHETACTDVPSALKERDVLRINEWPDSKFEMSLMRDGALVFPPTLLAPYTITLPNESERTIGYYADVALPVDRSDLTKTIDVRYIVYLSSAKLGLRTVKYYTVEVFENTKECRAEMPNPKISGLQSCRKIDLDLKGEMPSGGGGEPPPKN